MLTLRTYKLTNPRIFFLSLHLRYPSASSGFASVGKGVAGSRNKEPVNFLLFVSALDLYFKICKDSFFCHQFS
jgi:hypothetical protein